jgi:hypothetical protein
MPLNKRTKVKSTAPPKPRVEEEPETTLEKGAVSVASGESLPILGWCKACECFASHSRVDNLCYNCHMDVAGLVFDDEAKTWIKKKEKKK